jgi:formate hydrogenlyase subunit 4
MSLWHYLVSPVVALALAPLLPGIINRTKAFFAGRKGQPLLQNYYDLMRLFRKGMVISDTTTWIFRAVPLLVFCLTLAAACLVPIFTKLSTATFTGDVVLLLYLLAAARFLMMLAALDTGSAFEGMGASREAFFSALAEPVAFICLLSVMRANGSSDLMAALATPMTGNSIAVLLAAVPFFVILLSENARIPFDDPNTHLELTMIHEVMILDNSGPGLALLEYAASIKLWIFSLILAWILLPLGPESPILQTAALLLLIGLIAVAIGIVESCTARVRLKKVPQLLMPAGVAALLGFLISVTGALTW